MNKFKIKNLLITFLSAIVFSSTSAFADGHVKYSVTSANLAEYVDMLNPGQVNMFAQYPDTYRMDVYEESAACQLDPDIAAISQSNGTMINDN